VNSADCVNDFDFVAPGQKMPELSIRETLFGDRPLDAWPASSTQAGSQESWASFVRARKALAGGREAEAVDLWRCVIEDAGVGVSPLLAGVAFPSRAWHQAFQRRGEELLGVVVEVHLEEGLDLLAAYADHHARYLNFSGVGVIWERADQSLDPYVDALLASGSTILRAIGPWTGPRPEPPRVGQMRLNLLSPAGLHFGEGPMSVLTADPFAGPAVRAATMLMQRLVELAPRR
jgi:hypothetical protein